MGKHVHKLTKIDASKLRAECLNCGPVNIKPKQDGYRCRIAEAKWKTKDRTYIMHRKNECAMCGLVPKHYCQLDVDHIDNDHTNNHISNLQTLCSNCHRLKSHKCQPSVIY